jgi:L-iditol 2-dehydrogenase
MKAALFYGPDKIEIKDTPFPKPSEGYVLLKTLSCSVCSYDVRTFRNGSFKVKPPVILGHEICALTVDELVVGEKRLKSNTRVSLYPVIPCLTCWYCKNERFNLCSNLLELGSTVNGGFAEYIVIPKKLFTLGGLIPVPFNVSNEEASLIEPLACCLNGIKQVKDMDFDSITILGDGPIGLMQLLLFKKYFPELKVTVMGRKRKRLDVASKIGADNTVWLKGNNLSQTQNKLKKNRNRYAPNLIFVSNNHPNSIHLAFDLANKNGKIVLFSGTKNLATDKAIPMVIDPNFIHYNQISLFGSFSSTPNDLNTAMNLVSSKEIDLSHFITNTFQLEELEKALTTSEKLIGLKSIINKF